MPHLTCLSHITCLSGQIWDKGWWNMDATEQYIHCKPHSVLFLMQVCYSSWKQTRLMNDAHGTELGHFHVYHVSSMKMCFYNGKERCHITVLTKTDGASNQFNLLQTLWYLLHPNDWRLTLGCYLIECWMKKFNMTLEAMFLQLLDAIYERHFIYEQTIVQCTTMKVISVTALPYLMKYTSNMVNR